MSTPKQLAEKIGIEYHHSHVSANSQDSTYKLAITPLNYSWNAFLVCTHEICEDSRTLIGHLEKQEVGA